MRWPAARDRPVFRLGSEACLRSDRGRPTQHYCSNRSLARQRQRSLPRPMRPPGLRTSQSSGWHSFSIPRRRGHRPFVAGRAPRMRRRRQGFRRCSNCPCGERGGEEDARSRHYCSEEDQTSWTGSCSSCLPFTVCRLRVSCSAVFSRLW